LRYAIFQTPDTKHPLNVAASNWLGRSAFGLEVTDPVDPNQWSAKEHANLIADAARYGFHATLKAPFTLAHHRDEAALIKAFKAFKVSAEDLVIPSLELKQIHGFFALVPEYPVDAINDFAALIVQQFDEFRAPLTAADVARRDPDRLTDLQRGYLENWGYPYVFDEFFLHMTLTNRVSDQKSNEVRSMLEAHFAQFIGRPYPITHIALFVEPEAGAAFNVVCIRPIADQPTSKIESDSNEQ
jgi:putative phosphonate metabolism protein